jgi:hypothetical protein
MKLYFNPQSRAVIARWMLDECGVDYGIVPVDLVKGDTSSNLTASAIGAQMQTEQQLAPAERMQT